MITSAQIRAARALLKWSGKELAEKSGIGFSTLMKMESDPGVPNSNFKTFEAIKNTLESEGIEFIGSPNDAPGVRLHKRQ